jgi:hypothetical protein
MATTISDFLLRVKVTGQSAIDSLTKSTNDADKSLNKASSSADKFGKTVKDLGGVVSGSMGSGISQVDGMASALGNLGKMGAGIGLIAAAFVGLGMRAINAADQISDLSDATGISAGRLLNFKQSIVEAGGKTEDFEKMSAKLNQTLGEAAQGNEKVRKTFRDLGVSLGDANGNIRSTDELLPEILSALAAIPDTATRSATAVDLFGKAANKLDITNLKAAKDVFKDAEIKALGDYRNEIDKLTNSIETNLVSAFGKLAMAINKAFSGPATTMEKFKAGLYSMLPGDLGKSGIEGIKSDVKARMETDAESQRLANRANAAIGGAPTAGAVAGTGQLKITEAGSQAIKNAQAQTSAMRETNDLQNKYATSLNATLGMQQQAGDLARANLQIDFERDKKIADINKQIKLETNNKERDSRVTAGIVAELNKQVGIEMTAAEQRKTAKQNELQQLQYQKDLMADIMLLNQNLTQNVQLGQLSNQNKLIGLYGEELKEQQGLMSIENERFNAVLAARNKYEALGKDKNAKAAEMLRGEIAQAQSVADMKVEILKDQLKREEEARLAAKAGSEETAKAIARQFEGFNKAAMQTNAVWSGMSNAIDTFVDTGKIKFGDFARSIIQDLIKIELKAQATSLLKSVGGFTGILSSIAGFFSGRAAGGPVSANTPYVVGEKGPELFMPNTAGKIVPNGGSIGGGGGGAVNAPITNNYITNNISAIDSKSVAQLFAENRKTLLGTVELARKELPYSAGR